MNKKLIATMIAAAAFASVHAQAQQTYAGISVGQSTQKAEVSGAGSLKDDDTAFKLLAGYQFDRNWGIEAGYVHHGETGVGNNPRVTSKPQSFYVAGTATLPLENNFSLFAKLGASYNRTKFAVTGFGSDTENHTSVLAGVGAAYAFTANVSGVVEYEHFGKLVKDDGGSLKAHVWSIGVRTSF